MSPLFDFSHELNQTILTVLLLFKPHDPQKIRPFLSHEYLSLIRVFSLQRPGLKFDKTSRKNLSLLRKSIPEIFQSAARLLRILKNGQEKFEFIFFNVGSLEASLQELMSQKTFREILNRSWFESRLGKITYFFRRRGGIGYPYGDEFGKLP